MADRALTMTFLIDTNVLVYAIDRGQPERQATCRRWLSNLIDQDAAALSTQALSELANVLLNRVRPSWDPGRVIEHVGQLSRTMTVLPITPNVVLESLRGVEEHKMSYYDAQMWAIAHLHQIPYLVTEDMDSGAVIDGVLFVNPFDAEPPSTK